MTAQVIGLLGAKGAGKDTAADYLVASAGFSKTAFGDPLYREVAEAYGVAESLLRDRTTKETPLEVLGGISPRQALQDHGMARRRENPDYWVKQIRDRIAQGGNWVITDVRMPNEADLVRAFGGVLVRVTRPALPDSGDSHVTEQALADYPADAEVINIEDRPRHLWSAMLAVPEWAAGPEATGT